MPATDKTRECKLVFRYFLPGCKSPVENFLNAIKKFCRDQRPMTATICLAIPIEVACINPLSQKLVYV
jgi:hypothetical protein